MDDMQTAAQAWIEQRSLRARQAGQKIVLTPRAGGTPQAPPEVAPAPEHVTCESEVSQEAGGYFRYQDAGGEALIPVAEGGEDAPGGFFRYYDSRGEAVNVPRIRLSEERLQSLGLPTGLREFVEGETERIVTGQARIHEALSEVVVGDPEGLAAERRRSERLTQELKEAYAELAALRRATAGVGKPAGKRFFESLGQAIEQDADGLLDLLDTFDDLPDEVAAFLRAMAKNLSGFALNCLAYGQTL